MAKRAMRRWKPAAARYLLALIKSTASAPNGVKTENNLNEFNQTTSLKSIKKITKLKEKNYQLEMKLSTVTHEVSKIKIQAKINANNLKIDLFKQINNVKCTEYEQLLQIKYDNNNNKLIKHRLNKDIKTNAKATIINAKLQEAISSKDNKFQESYGLSMSKKSKNTLSSNLSNNENYESNTMNLTKKELKENIDYEAIANKFNSTVGYLNNIALIEQNETNQYAQLEFDNNDNPNLAVTLAKNEAITNFKVNINNADYNKLMSSLNLKYHKVNENGVGESSKKLINKVAKLSYKYAKKQFAHANANAEAHKAINACKTSLEQQSREQFAKKIEKLKTKASKQSNERIKNNILNYLDSLMHSNENLEVETFQEGGNN